MYNEKLSMFKRLDICLLRVFIWQNLCLLVLPNIINVCAHCM
jgi:hypothetical protein